MMKNKYPYFVKLEIGNEQDYSGLKCKCQGGFHPLKVASEIGSRINTTLLP